MMRILLNILVFFIIAQLLGVYTGFVILSDMPENPYVQQFVITEEKEEVGNAVLLFLYVLFGAALLLVLIRFYKGELLFRIIEFIVVSSASSIVFYSVFRLFFGYGESVGIGIVLGLLLAGLKFFKPSLKNAAAIIATAGVGVVFGISLGVFSVVVLLVLLSIYDYIAVFRTRHMVKMAEFITKRELAFTVTSRRMVPEEKRERRIDLGSGDLIGPLMLEVSLLSYSIVASAFVFVGATLALGGLLVFMWRKKIVLPALPPIAFGALLFLAIGFLTGFY